MAWVTVFGPGAIVASLTIGTGELLFSARAGSLFRYDILWLFLATCILKWALVFCTGRHLVLSGGHPLQRYCELPGPRAWFPILLLIFGVSTFPVWNAFLSGVLGTLGQNLAQNYDVAIDSHVFAAAAIVIITAAWLTGGYDRVERVQVVIVVTMLVAVSISVIMLNPDWVAILKGLFVPKSLAYPDWLSTAPEPVQAALADRPVWLETTNYVGVIGGSGFDYLCYVSFMRNKTWGMTKGPAVPLAELEAATPEQKRLLRSWLRAPLVDATVSFAIVLVFAIVFVAAGETVLRERELIPHGDNLLNQQAEVFRTAFDPSWADFFVWLYVAGAILAMVGTLYGLLELVPALIAEAVCAIMGRPAPNVTPKLRLGSAIYVSLSGLGILLWSYLYSRAGGEGNPPALVAIITPANLFTGVLACSFICILNPWMDFRFLPKGMRMHPILVVLNVIGGIFFGILGATAYWEWGQSQFPDGINFLGFFRLDGSVIGVVVFCVTVLIGFGTAIILRVFRGSSGGLQSDA